MKIAAIFINLLAISLAAPSEVATDEKKIVVQDKIESTEKLLEKDETLKPSSDHSNVDKVVEKIANKSETLPASPEEKVPVIVVEEAKTDEEKIKKEEDEDKDSIQRENSAICRASTGATEEQIAAIKEKPDDDAPQAVKCYIKCISEAYGDVNEDQAMQRDEVLKHKPATVDAREFETAVDNCAELKTDDPCDSAYLRYSCYFRTTGKTLKIY